MSDTCTTKVLYEDDKRYVVSLTNSSDGTGEYRIKKVTDNLRIKNIKYSLGTMKALMELESSNIPKNSVTMTYAAAGSSGITIADNDNIDFGTSNFTLRWKGSLPNWSPTGNSYLIYKLNGTCAYGLAAMAAGNFRLYTGDSHGGIVYKDSNTHSLVNGTSHEIVGVVVAPTASVAGSITFYIDGSILGTPVTVAATSNWTASDNGALNICGTNSSRNASTNSSVTLYNRALTSAEVLSLYQNGVATADKWGSQTAKYTSDFSADANGWTATRGAVAGNIDAIGGENDWLRYTVDANLGAHLFKKTTILTAGKRFRVTLKYYIPSTNSNLDGFEIRDDEGYSVTASGTYNTTDAATTITYDCATTLQGASTGISIYTKDGTDVSYQDAGGNDVIYIKTVSVYEIGATLDLEPAGIGAAAWTDSSSNGLNASYPAAGCTPNLLNNPYKPYILSDNGEINVDTDMSGKLITDIFLTTIGHASGATYNIILDCEKF